MYISGRNSRFVKPSRRNFIKLIIAFQSIFHAIPIEVRSLLDSSTSNSNHRKTVRSRSIEPPQFRKPFISQRCRVLQFLAKSSTVFKIE